MTLRLSLLALVAATGVLAAPAAGAQGQIDRNHVPSDERVNIFERRQTNLDANNLRTTVFNFGQEGRTAAVPGEIPYEWPKNTRRNYIALTGFFAGAEVVGESGSREYIVDVPNYRQNPDNPNQAWTWAPISGYVNTADEALGIARSDIPASWPLFWPDKLQDPTDPGWTGSWSGLFGKNVFNADLEVYYKIGDDQYARGATQHVLPGLDRPLAPRPRPHRGHARARVEPGPHPGRRLHAALGQERRLQGPLDRRRHAVARRPRRRRRRRLGRPPVLRPPPRHRLPHRRRRPLLGPRLRRGPGRRRHRVLPREPGQRRQPHRRRRRRHDRPRRGRRSTTTASRPASPAAPSSRSRCSSARATRPARPASASASTASTTTATASSTRTRRAPSSASRSASASRTTSTTTATARPARPS